MIPGLIILSSRLLAHPRVKFMTQNQEKGIDPVVGTSPLKMQVACPKKKSTLRRRIWEIWYNESELTRAGLSGESF
jgi:hypothetical protein